jgi:serine/threonine-protein kinase RsbW
MLDPGKVGYQEHADSHDGKSKFRSPRMQQPATAPPPAAPATWYQRTFHGRVNQVREVRHEIAAHLARCPAADDAVLIASELAANSVTHSASAGEFFTVRCQVYPTYVWIEVEDLGGPWQLAQPDDRPHGLDIIGALAGPDNWGAETTSDGDRIVWVRLDLPGERMPDPGRVPDVARLTSGELKRARRELAISLALTRPGSPVRGPIMAHLSAIDAEIAGRGARQS